MVDQDYKDVETIVSLGIHKLGEEFRHNIWRIKDLLEPNMIEKVYSPGLLDTETLREVQQIIRRCQEIVNSIPFEYTPFYASRQKFREYFRNELRFDLFDDTTALLSAGTDGLTVSDFKKEMERRGYNYCREDNGYMIFCKYYGPSEWEIVYVPIQGDTIKVESDGTVPGSYVKYDSDEWFEGLKFCETDGAWYKEEEYESFCPKDYKEFRF